MTHPDDVFASIEMVDPELIEIDPALVLWLPLTWID
jgi:hypothetical protein